MRCGLLSTGLRLFIAREAIRVGEGGGHFIRRGGNIKSYGVSKAVDSLVKKPPKVPFML